jgi:hypothetical protein
MYVAFGLPISIKLNKSGGEILHKRGSGPEKESKLSACATLAGI